MISLTTKMTDYQMIVVANREPYIHRFAGDVDRVPASGQRHGRGARPGDEGRGRRLGRARLGRRRPGDGRRVTTTSRFLPKIPLTRCAASG